MASYAQLRRQLASLQAEVESARKAELLPIIKRMQRDMATHGITAADLSSEVANVKTAIREVAGKKRGGRGGIAKYQDPKTGLTWSGFGRAPGWISKARDRTKFLIDGTAASASPASTKTSAKASPDAPKKRTRATTSSNTSKTAAVRKPTAPNKKASSGATTKKAAHVKKRAPGISRKQKPFAGQNASSAPDVSDTPAS